ncbi:MAG: aminoacyl-tRNA hydrolase [Akkermansia sp.]
MSAPIKIIVGLGNPGQEYRNTRHNVGFMVLDRIASQLGAIWKMDKARKGEIANGGGVLLIKPQTYMNESGLCVGPIMRYFKFEPEQVLVVYDEIAFPVGTLKLRNSGSAGGHNGVKSLIAHLGSDRFPRLRLGVGGPKGKSMTSHVLGGFAPDEQEGLARSIEQSALACLCALRDDFQAAANLYNTKKEKKPKVQKEVAVEESADEAEQSEQKTSL